MLAVRQETTFDEVVNVLRRRISIVSECRIRRCIGSKAMIELAASLRRAALFSSRNSEKIGHIYTILRTFFDNAKCN